MREITPDLRKEELVSDVPCGKCIETLYFDGSGVMVRKDVRIEVKEGLLTEGTGGSNSSDLQ
jgi:hypothetical protein